MDCRYIEQLLERYWQCETSLEEEARLRDFFLNEEVPEPLLPYKDLFVYQNLQQRVGLGEGFDERILHMVEADEPLVVKAKRITLLGRLSPLFKAAALVAIVILSGNLVQRSFSNREVLDYNYDSYTDTYSDPEVAYKEVSSALMMLSEGLNKSEQQHPTDSVAIINEMEKR